MRSAGLIPYRLADELEILIAHPGGPFWARRQAGAWSIVKGEIAPAEDPLPAARREFTEETGWLTPDRGYIDLGEVVQKAGKTIVAWAFEAAFDPATLRSEMITIEVRGKAMTIPEIDTVRWCGANEAKSLLNPAQAEYYQRLKSALGQARERHLNGKFGS